MLTSAVKAYAKGDLVTDPVVSRGEELMFVLAVKSAELFVDNIALDEFPAG